jgi:hypothetical protein
MKLGRFFDLAATEGFKEIYRSARPSLGRSLKPYCLSILATGVAGVAEELLGANNSVSAKLFHFAAWAGGVGSTGTAYLKTGWHYFKDATIRNPSISGDDAVGHGLAGGLLTGVPVATLNFAAYTGGRMLGKGINSILGN